MQASNWLLQQTCDRLATNVEPALCNQKLYYQKLYYIILAAYNEENIRNKNEYFNLPKTAYSDWYRIGRNLNFIQGNDYVVVELPLRIF